MNVHLSSKHIERLSIGCFLLVIVLFSASAHADEPIVLSPVTPRVTTGQTVKISANEPALFKLDGPGECVGCGATPVDTITYTAPGQIEQQNTVLGCPAQPSDSIFNSRIDSLPIAGANTDWIKSSSPSPFTFEPSWGASYADASTPRRSLVSYYGGYTNSFPWPSFSNLRRENGNFLGSTGFRTPDHHAMIIDASDCMFYETYGDKVNGDTVVCQDGTQGCNVSSAISYSWADYSIQNAGGTDAAGLPLAPLLLHLSELVSGSVEHALRFSTSLGFIQGDPNKGTPLAWPASRSNGCSTSTCPNAPIIGSRLRLKQDFDINNFAPFAQTVLTAMKLYGMFLSDIGTGNAVTVSTDLETDPAAMSALYQITAARLTLSDMEWVDESSLQESSHSYRVCAFGRSCGANLNKFEKPTNQVTITATTATQTISIPVAVRAVAISSRLQPNVLVMAGSYEWGVKTWVSGSSDQRVSWTLKSGVGSITKEGLYSPPVTAADGTSAVIHGEALADKTSTIDFHLTILPSGPIRIDTGATQNTVDRDGNPWLGNLQPEGYGFQYNDNYPSWATDSPLKEQFQSGVYTYGADLLYPNIVVPNGNYNVAWLLGLNDQCGTIPCSSFLRSPSDIYIYSPVHLESQAQVGYFAYDWLRPVDYVSAVPSPIVSIPALVTDNVLYVAVRTYSVDAPDPPLYAPGPDSGKTAILSGLIISRDDSVPHWAIDTRQQQSIVPGQSLLPFRVVDWFTGTNDPIWTVLGEGATVTTSRDEFGLTVCKVSLSSTNYKVGEPITIIASDGTYSAQAQVNVLAAQVGRRIK